MEVTKELRESLHEAITLALEEGAKGTDILDDVVVDAVVAVLVKHEVEIVDMAGKKRVPVKYVGKRESYTDGLFSTGMWRKGDVKLISYSTAMQMLDHADVYADGDEDSAVDVVDIDDKKAAEDKEAERLEETRNLVQQMTRKATVAEFVATNYNGLKIPAELVKLDEMKEFAVRQIDRYGII